MGTATRNQPAAPPPAGGDGAPQRRKWSRGKKITTGAAAGVAALAIAGGVVFGLQPRTHDEASPENTVPPTSAELADDIVEVPAAEAAPAAPAPAPASDLVTVPDVVGMTGMEAQAALLDGAGLRMIDFVSPNGVSQIPNDQARVVAQSSQPGERVARDTAITVTISIADSAMPNLVGMTGTDAKAALARIGFEPEWAEWVTADGSPVAEPAGTTVIGQSPSAGTAVYPGDAVRITVR